MPNSAGLLIISVSLSLVSAVNSASFMPSINVSVRELSEFMSALSIICATLNFATTYASSGIKLA